MGKRSGRLHNCGLILIKRYRHKEFIEVAIAGKRTRISGNGANIGLCVTQESMSPVPSLTMIPIQNAYRINDMDDYLPFTSWQMPRIDICSFECSKPKFTGCCIIGMRASEDNRDLQFFEGSQCTFALVIRCIIQQDHRIFSPVRPLLV